MESDVESSSDQLLELPRIKQEEWFKLHREHQFKQSLMECPVVAMSVDISHVFDELLESLPDYNHGLQFIHSGLVSDDRVTQLEGGSPLNKDEQKNLKHFLLTELIDDEIFDDKITEARWFEFKTNGVQLGAVFIGTNHPLMEPNFDFFGLFKTKEDVKDHLKEFGELVDPDNYY